MSDCRSAVAKDFFENFTEKMNDEELVLAFICHAFTCKSCLQKAVDLRIMNELLTNSDFSSYIVAMIEDWHVECLKSNTTIPQMIIDLIPASRKIK